MKGAVLDAPSRVAGVVADKSLDEGMFPSPLADKLNRAISTFLSERFHALNGRSECQVTASEMARAGYIRLEGKLPTFYTNSLLNTLVQSFPEVRAIKNEIKVPYTPKG